MRNAQIQINIFLKPEERNNVKNISELFKTTPEFVLSAIIRNHTDLSYRKASIGTHSITLEYVGEVPERVTPYSIENILTRDLGRKFSHCIVWGNLDRLPISYSVYQSHDMDPALAKRNIDILTLDFELAHKASIEMLKYSGQ